jgi:hypothetical protein
MSNKVKERNTYIVTVAFFDHDDDPVTPDSATYRIDDVKSGQILVPVTAIVSLGVTVDIEITPLQNQIIDDNNVEELRRLTVMFYYDTVRQGADEYFYRVMNLKGVLYDG